MASTTNFLVGISISLFGSTASNLGVNVQKYSQILNNKKVVSERRGYLMQPLWWSGLFAVVLGAVCDFGALSFAPQSVIMPVGSFTLVANVLFAHFWLGEDLGYSDIVGTVLIVGGATTIAVAYGALGELRDHVRLTSAAMMDLYKRWTVLFFGLFVILMLVVFYALSLQCEHVLRTISKVDSSLQDRTLHTIKEGDEEEEEDNEESEIDVPLNKDDKWSDGTASMTTTTAGGDYDRCKAIGKYHPILAAIAAYFSEYENLKRWHPLSYAAVSGTFGSFSVVYGKSIGMLLGNTFDGTANEFARPYLYVTILCIVVSVLCQTHFLALGLKYFDALYIVPVFQCFFITLSIFGGAIYWKETASLNTTQWVVFLLGVILVLWGVFLMSSRDMEVDGMGVSLEDEDGDNNAAGAGDYVSLDGGGVGGDIELSGDGPLPRSRPRSKRQRRSTTAEVLGNTIREVITRPISVLIQPELLQRREGYFGSDGNVDSSAALSSTTPPRRPASTRRKMDMKVMGLLPVFLDPDLEDAGTALGFGLGFDDFGGAFSLHRTIERSAGANRGALGNRQRSIARRQTMGSRRDIMRNAVSRNVSMPRLTGERQRSGSDGLVSSSYSNLLETSFVSVEGKERSADDSDLLDTRYLPDDEEMEESGEENCSCSRTGKIGEKKEEEEEEEASPTPRNTRSSTFVL